MKDVKLITYIWLTIIVIGFLFAISVIIIDKPSKKEIPNVDSIYQIETSGKITEYPNNIPTKETNKCNPIWQFSGHPNRLHSYCQCYAMVETLKVRGYDIGNIIVINPVSYAIIIDSSDNIFNKY